MDYTSLSDEELAEVRADSERAMQEARERWMAAGIESERRRVQAIKAARKAELEAELAGLEE